jgi:AraC family transcriptional regulator
VIDSLKAGQFLQASMTTCSWQAGWRSLLLRSYVDPPVVDNVRTPATADQLIVLVTGRRCDIEARYGRRTQKATYGAGSLGMTGPGEEARLSWSSDRPHTTLQLHLPARTLRRVSGELSQREARARIPSSLHFTDPVVGHLMLARIRHVICLVKPAHFWIHHDAPEVGARAIGARQEAVPAQCRAPDGASVDAPVSSMK